MLTEEKTRRLRFRQGLVICLLSWVLLSSLHLAGVFSVVDLKILDIRFRLRGERQASETIALVEVDDATIAAYRRWPLTRDTYALLIAALEGAGARAIGVDLLFLSRDNENPQADDLLANITAGFGNIVHGISFLPEAQPGSADEVLSRETRELLREQGIQAKDIEAATAGTVLLPFPELLRASSALGHVTVAVDRDGATRRVPLLVRYGDRLYPALGLRLAAMVRDEEFLPELRATRRGYEIGWPNGLETTVPVDDEGGTTIDFAGTDSAFPLSFSMLDVLRWFREGDAAELTQSFKGRIVLIGNTAVGQAAADVGTTPFETATPLVYVHANVVDAILNNHFIYPLSTPLCLLILLGLTFLLAWVFVRLSVPTAAVVMAAAVALLAIIEFLLFVTIRVNVPSGVTLLLPPLAYASTASYRFVFLERKAREQENELRVAHSIQEKLLPAGPPELAELDIFGTNIPAREIGGDYFDWLPLGEKSFAVVIGDVSGKGVSAALLMSHLHGSLHAETRIGDKPREIVEAMNVSLARATEPHRFATFFLASVSREEEKLVYCNAGHGPVLLVSQGKVEVIGPTGVPLGVFEDAEYGDEARAFGHGDMLILCSDGVTECDRHGELYGDERLLALVGKLSTRELSARQVADSILSDIHSFSTGECYADDVTIVVVRRK